MYSTTIILTIMLENEKNVEKRKQILRFIDNIIKNN